VEFIVRENIVQPKTSGPSQTVSVLVGEWAARQRPAASIRLRMRIMRLTDVRFPPAIPGQFRAATMVDLDVTAPWGEGFSRELGLDPTVDRRNVARRIELNRLFLWCDPEPVSMAGISGPTPNGIRVNFVYTPPGARGKGYARACVARLSQSMLDSGKKFVFLYVDADNPRTNRLYTSIGYDPVCDWEDWRFETSGQ
jgi:predicted GNAT family acetyltransferase